MMATMRPFTLLLLATLALGAPPLAAVADEAPRLVPSADGRELIDTAAGLAWSRCLEGMRWDGAHCVGSPRLATHAEALAQARERGEAEGQPWRVPRVTELKRLVERLARGKDGQALAPAAPAGWYWTSTTRIESEAVNPYAYRNVERGATQRQVDRLVVQSGWAVEQPGANVRGDVSKRQKLQVRLVRTLDAPAHR